MTALPRPDTATPAGRLQAFMEAFAELCQDDVLLKFGPIGGGESVPLRRSDLEAVIRDSLHLGGLRGALETAGYVLPPF